MRTIVPLAAALAALSLAAPARADSTPTSTISQLMVVEPSDPKHRLFHGAVWLQADKATQNYRWGGKHCNNATVSSEHLRLLFEAFHHKYSVTLEYQSVRYRDSVYRCISGFTITR